MPATRNPYDAEHARAGNHLDAAIAIFLDLGYTAKEIGAIARSAAEVTIRHGRDSGGHDGAVSVGAVESPITEFGTSATATYPRNLPCRAGPARELPARAA